MLFVVCSHLASCKEERYIVREIPVEVPKVEAMYRTDTVIEIHFIERNNILMTDSSKGLVDTVRVTVREVRDRYRSVHDTAHDSVAVPVYLHDTVDITDHAAMSMAEGRLEEARRSWLVAVLLLVVAVLIRMK